MSSLHVAHDLLACPHCGAGLAANDRSWRCPAGHSFDVAKQGYLNLADGPEPANADTAAMLDARARVRTRACSASSNRRSARSSH